MPLLERWRAPTLKLISMRRLIFMVIKWVLGLLFVTSMAWFWCLVRIWLLVFSLLMFGETLAILRGIQIVTDMGFSSVCVEFDAATIMKQLSSKVISCSDVGLIVEDILTLASCFSNFSISFVRWSANKVAHGLAKLTLSHHSDDVWVENVPSCGASLVSNDIRVIL
ncbi:hypothetical protein ACOSQ3_003134 [Xanthoceras sorbifolium]